MPIIRRSDFVPLPTVVCPVVAVVMLTSNILHTVHSAQCTHLATRLSSITTATTGQAVERSWISWWWA